MITLEVRRELEENLDFMYGYLLLRAYFFIRRTGVMESEYPNRSYVEAWRRCRLDEEDLKNAFKLVSINSDASCLDLCDTFDRASYFALVHPKHPNITLGFIKDSDLWNMWLTESPFKLSREAIADLLALGSDKLRVVDYGCGSVSPLYYGNIMGSRGTYTGIDYSQSMVSIARFKAKSEKLDWVNIRKGNVESKLVSVKKYDAVICSSVIQYVNNIPALLRNAAEMLDYDGTMVIFSELFRDVEPEKKQIMDLYYSLIPEFKKFPAISEILGYLDTIASYRCRVAGRNLLVIEFNGK